MPREQKTGMYFALFMVSTVLTAFAIAPPAHSVSIDFPTDGQVISDSAPTFQWTPDNAGEILHQVKVFEPGQVNPIHESGKLAVTEYAMPEDLLDGSYTVRVESFNATDPNPIGTAEACFVVDRENPTVEITQPTADCVEGSGVNVVADLSDSVSGMDVDGEPPALLVNGTPTDAIPEFSRRQTADICGGQVTTGVSVTWPDVQISSGDQLTVQVNDRGGNQGEDMVVVSVCTPTPTQTNTPTETFTATPTPTETPVPTDTPTPTETPVPTETPTATDTETPVPTATPTVTETEIPTNTSVPTETNTPAASNTPTEAPTVNQAANLIDMTTGENTINAFDLFVFALNWKQTNTLPGRKDSLDKVPITDVDLLDLAVADKQWSLATPPDPTSTPTSTTEPSPTPTETSPDPTSTPTETPVDPTATPTSTEAIPQGDINSDSSIDAKDLLLLIQDFGRSY